MGLLSWLKQMATKRVPCEKKEDGEGTSLLEWKLGSEAYRRSDLDHGQNGKQGWGNEGMSLLL